MDKTEIEAQAKVSLKIYFNIKKWWYWAWSITAVILFYSSYTMYPASSSVLGLPIDFIRASILIVVYYLFLVFMIYANQGLYRNFILKKTGIDLYIEAEKTKVLMQDVVTCNQTGAVILDKSITKKSNTRSHLIKWVLITIIAGIGGYIYLALSGNITISGLGYFMLTVSAFLLLITFVVVTIVVQAIKVSSNKDSRGLSPGGVLRIFFIIIIGALLFLISAM